MMERMMDWAQFEVVEVRKGAVYEDTVYDQDLIVRTESGTLLTLFDMTPMIARGVVSGQRLEAVVQVLADLRRGARATLVANVALERTEWAGFRDDLVHRTWQRVSAPDGHLLIPMSELERAKLQLGDSVDWDDGRYDLMAWRPLEAIR
jgi:hypothetical protein